ncbi:MAG TPA: site-specific integrase [Usitatibacter sp.]|nr:site-specific integrase [Usitatibacter sp.]
MQQRGKARVPTEVEFKRLFGVARAGAHPKRNAALLTVSYRLGLRAKEIAGLRISDVLDPSWRLREECSLSGQVTKGGKPRIAYLTSPAVKHALREYLEERRLRDGVRFTGTAPVFRSQKGGAFSPNSMQQLLRRLHDRAGIIGGRSHSGRRWFATELIAKGVDLKAVSVLMGHSSVAMTAQYAEDNPQRLRRIAAEL